MSIIAGKELSAWTAALPLLADLIACRETSWFNPGVLAGEAALAPVGLSVSDIDDAAARLRRFAPYLAQVFPTTRRMGGIIESPLYAIPGMQAALEERADTQIPGRLWIKMDAELPVSGSIKARGGIYEVLHHAERVALDAGFLSLGDDYRKLDSPAARELFGRHAIAVGSTGNLGLSIGIMAAQLGFRVTVHMSADARIWKKNLLRRHGVEVREYASDYSVAVAEGRQAAEKDPAMYFVDDENSRTLFLGYAVAARRLAGQLRALDVAVDRDHPLLVYLPCGVGGGPGGVAFGLKTIFGDACHPVFAEPTHSPCLFLGVYTGLHDHIAVQDFGIDNATAADGLAVGRASGFVGRAMEKAIDEYYTVTDDTLFSHLALLDRAEELRVEPSAAAGFPGPLRVLADDAYQHRAGLTTARLANATHLVWATGGSMVPEAEMSTYLEHGTRLV
ncbi:MAG: D-serine ammonia-lyase [Propionibacteriaceae bacterium]|nr:D-serine ammonia-lyase [Propionibacteriaceae bacterium]